MIYRTITNSKWGHLFGGKYPFWQEVIVILLHLNEGNKLRLYGNKSFLKRDLTDCGEVFWKISRGKPNCNSFAFSNILLLPFGKLYWMQEKAYAQSFFPNFPNHSGTFHAYLISFYHPVWKTRFIRKFSFSFINFNALLCIWKKSFSHKK